MALNTYTPGSYGLAAASVFAGRAGRTGRHRGVRARIAVVDQADQQRQVRVELGLDVGGGVSCR